MTIICSETGDEKAVASDDDEINEEVSGFNLKEWRKRKERDGQVKKILKMVLPDATHSVILSYIRSFAHLTLSFGDYEEVYWTPKEGNWCAFYSGVTQRVEANGRFRVSLAFKIYATNPSESNALQQLQPFGKTKDMT